MEASETQAASAVDNDDLLVNSYEGGLAGNGGVGGAGGGGDSGGRG